MSLTAELVNKFVKATKDDDREVQNEAIVYGTTVEREGRLYVEIDGSEGRLTPVATTTNAKSGERVLVMLKNHTATITGNITSPSARAVDVADAAKSASNFMYYDPAIGVEVGDKSTGEWAGCRTRMSSNSFDVLDEDGDVVAKYGKTTVELGANNDDSAISMCNKKLLFTCDSDTNSAQMRSNMLYIRTKDIGVLDAMDGSEYAGVSVTTNGPLFKTSVQIRASEEDDETGDVISSGMQVQPARIELNGNLFINSKSLLDCFHPVNSVYISYSHDDPAYLFGGEWERISPYFLYGTGETGVIGEEVTVSINKDGDTGQGIKVSIWRRIA